MADAPTEPWVRFAAAHEAYTAAAWKQALLEEGISAVVEIEDARRVTRRNLPWGVRGASMFMYGVSVPESDRERAHEIVSRMRVRRMRFRVFGSNHRPVARGAFLVMMGAAFVFAARSGLW